MAIDFNALTAEDLIALKARLDGLTDVSGRSPMRPRQLTNLLLLPTKDDPRPTFFMSADAPRGVDTTRTTLYPELLWHPETGVEITVTDAKTHTVYVNQGYLSHPLFEVKHDPMDLLAAALDALSQEDRSALIEAQRTDRIASLRMQLAAMPEDKLALLLAQSADAKPKGAKK